MEGSLVQSRVSQHLFDDYSAKNKTPVNFLLKSVPLLMMKVVEQNRVVMLTAVRGACLVLNKEF